MKQLCGLPGEKQVLFPFSSQLLSLNVELCGLFAFWTAIRTNFIQHHTLVLLMFFPCQDISYFSTFLHLVPFLFVFFSPDLLWLRRKGISMRSKQSKIARLELTWRLWHRLLEIYMALALDWSPGFTEYHTVVSSALTLSLALLSLSLSAWYVEIIQTMHFKSRHFAFYVCIGLSFFTLVSNFTKLRFFDILTPPYNPKGGRDCTYFDALTLEPGTRKRVLFSF